MEGRPEIKNRSRNNLEIDMGLVWGDTAVKNKIST